ncbi:MAG: hypothetical protein JJLCMIEE_03197 [Acidimicrobiales bacterium]|nr:hypothetical protein [Acidimicrobiales bacterium]
MKGCRRRVAGLLHRLRELLEWVESVVPEQRCGGSSERLDRRETNWALLVLESIAQRERFAHHVRRPVTPGTGDQQVVSDRPFFGLRSPGVGSQMLSRLCERQEGGVLQGEGVGLANRAQLEDPSGFSMAELMGEDVEEAWCPDASGGVEVFECASEHFSSSARRQRADPPEEEAFLLAQRPGDRDLIVRLEPISIPGQDGWQSPPHGLPELVLHEKSSDPRRVEADHRAENRAQTVWDDPRRAHFLDESKESVGLC